MKTLLSLVAMLALISGAAACSDDDSDRSRPSAEATATPAASAAANQDGDGPSGATSATVARDQSEATDIVQLVRESVVRVRAGGQPRPGPFGGGPPNEGTGTDFIIDPRGYIVTNNHVVTLGTDQPAAQLEVDLWNGTTLPATLVGRDMPTDLAVLKIDAPDVRALRFADPEAIAVGEEVFAIGFALDLGSSPTVTKGVVSAKDRVINETIQVGGRPVAVDISGAIQTDAAINPGNSGGPLVNLAGEVVGVNTAGLVGAAGRPVQGIFFAVSSQVAQPIVETLIETGNVERGFLGIGVTTITREIARASSLNVSEGAGVVQVQPGSPAAQAGLQPGDVITKIGDMSIRNVGDLSRALFRYGPGSSVAVEYRRAGETKTTEVAVAARPASAR